MMLNLAKDNRSCRPLGSRAILTQFDLTSDYGAMSGYQTFIKRVWGFSCAALGNSFRVRGAGACLAAHYLYIRDEV